MKAVVITIGDEILNGTTIDTNAAFLGRELSLLGIQLTEKISISDQADHICATLDRYLGNIPVILITGGLGPTKDDITKQTLCTYFGGKLVHNEQVFQFIKERFERRGLVFTARNQTQAMVPDVCTVIYNKNGTAPGMLFEKNGSLVFSMPGVPYEMKAMFTGGIIPVLKEKLTLPVLIHHHIMTSGIGESWLADQIADLEDALPSNIKLAYLPSPGVVKLRLTAQGDDSALQEAVQYHSQLLVERLGAYVYGFEEETLSEAVGRRLKKLGKTLSLAESCTGGFIGHLITSVPGSSAYFPGSVVSYNYDMKENILGVPATTLQLFGAVSEETVRAMLAGVRRISGSDYAVAVSGIAGPDGGTPEKPVGTVFIGVAGEQEVQVQRFTFGNSRLINIEYSAMFALHLLRMMLDHDLEKQGLKA